MSLIIIYIVSPSQETFIFCSKSFDTCHPAPKVTCVYILEIMSTGEEHACPALSISLTSHAPQKCPWMCLHQEYAAAHQWLWWVGSWEGGREGGRKIIATMSPLSSHKLTVTIIIIIVELLSNHNKNKNKIIQYDSCS